MRERGLKFLGFQPFAVDNGRSREGAWIEILESVARDDSMDVAPVRERGLKLYTCLSSRGCAPVAPVRERGLKSLPNRAKLASVLVAPVRERGLKSY